MGKEMIDKELVESTIAEALKTGGEFAEVFVEDKRSSSAYFDDGKVEELTSGRDRGAGIRVVVGETTGFAHTADLSSHGLMEAARSAAAAARSQGAPGSINQLAQSILLLPIQYLFFQKQLKKLKK